MDQKRFNFGLRVYKLGYGMKRVSDCVDSLLSLEKKMEEMNGVKINVSERKKIVTPEEAVLTSERKRCLGRICEMCKEISEETQKQKKLYEEILCNYTHLVSDPKLAPNELLEIAQDTRRILEAEEQERGESESKKVKPKRKRKEPRPGKENREEKSMDSLGTPEDKKTPPGSDTSEDKTHLLLSQTPSIPKPEKAVLWCEKDKAHILGRVVRFVGKEKVEIQDEDGTRRYTKNTADVVFLEKDGLSAFQKKRFQPKRTVYALYPGTTAFYKGTVCEMPTIVGDEYKRLKGRYSVLFDDDTEKYSINPLYVLGLE
ncbi:MAG: uncharacterized protein A8A55_0754 [Amphiamblys sp. WSBS2006]|nr:MAG: uncharacterized protein A8A55_0754 [Amphiamblys sp. WSBS2006]